MGLTKEHRIFIDKYIQTMDYAAAARAMGIPANEAITAGYDLALNPEIQEGIRKRQKDIAEIAKAVPITKEHILTVLTFQYQEASRQGKTKEAADILSQIAQAQGIDIKSIQSEPIQLIINNLDKDKI